MMAEQSQDIIAEQSEEHKPCRTDLDASTTDEHAGSGQSTPCSAGMPAEANQPPLLKSPKEDSASDLSTESGSDDSDENTGEVESPDVAMGSGFSSEETLFIFDWDDTLLPSTWVQQQGLRLDESSTATEEQAAKLHRMADNARRTLQGALMRGRVIIVTNGEQGWVELSCWKFMPLLAPILEGIPIVSARSTYEKQGFVSPFEWKLHAFRKEIHSFYPDGSNTRRNVLSLGDSMHEHMALVAVTQGMANCRAKSLKFTSFPELEQLIEQHELVSGRLDDIVDHDGDLSLEVLAA